MINRAALMRLQLKILENIKILHLRWECWKRCAKQRAGSGHAARMPICVQVGAPRAHKVLRSTIHRSHRSRLTRVTEALYTGASHLAVANTTQHGYKPRALPQRLSDDDYRARGNLLGAEQALSHRGQQWSSVESQASRMASTV